MLRRMLPAPQGEQGLEQEPAPPNQINSLEGHSGTRTRANHQLGSRNRRPLYTRQKQSDKPLICWKCVSSSIMKLNNEKHSLRMKLWPRAFWPSLLRSPLFSDRRGEGGRASASVRSHWEARSVIAEGAELKAWEGQVETNRLD